MFFVKLILDEFVQLINMYNGDYKNMKNEHFLSTHDFGSLVGRQKNLCFSKVFEIAVMSESDKNQKKVVKS